MNLKQIKSEDLIKELLAREDVEKYSEPGLYLEMNGRVTVIILKEYYSEFE